MQKKDGVDHEENQGAIKRTAFGACPAGPFIGSLT
jgi:hypothetical protein